MKNLERNKMKPYFCENREEAQALVNVCLRLYLRAVHVLHVETNESLIRKNEHIEGGCPGS